MLNPIHSYLQKIREAYHLGFEYSKLTTNRFWFGHKLTPDNSEHVYPREAWDSRIDEIKKQQKSLGLLEKLAFEIGDDSFTFSALPKPETIPIKPFE